MKGEKPKAGTRSARLAAERKAAAGRPRGVGTAPPTHTHTQTQEALRGLPTAAPHPSTRPTSNSDRVSLARSAWHEEGAPQTFDQ